MGHKQILVKDVVHKKVKKIADANYRAIGAQVEFWADNDCPHPQEERDEFSAHMVGNDKTLRFFHCKKCGQVICTSSYPTAE